MEKNPGYPTTNPYGYFQLWQWSTSSPLYIWGNMYNLPYAGVHEHGFAINSWNWNRKDCCSSGPHF